jgi:Uma2 family endonuclease
MTLPEGSGIEPDYCFYIDNWQAISGKKRIDWRSDPLPDLMIEVDVTSYSDIQDYLPYRVPEVWLFKRQSLLIYHFRNDDYHLVDQSRYFPNFDLHWAIAQCLQISSDHNSSSAIRHLKHIILS